jgi:hypothetical protein
VRAAGAASLVIAAKLVDLAHDRLKRGLIRIGPVLAP